MNKIKTLGLAILFMTACSMTFAAGFGDINISDAVSGYTSQDKQLSLTMDISEMEHIDARYSPENALFTFKKSENGDVEFVLSYDGNVKIFKEEYKGYSSKNGKAKAGIFLKRQLNPKDGNKYIEYSSTTGNYLERVEKIKSLKSPNSDEYSIPIYGNVVIYNHPVLDEIKPISHSSFSGKIFKLSVKTFAPLTEVDGDTLIDVNDEVIASYQDKKGKYKLLILPAKK